MSIRPCGMLSERPRCGHCQDGFTLVELLAVMIIITILFSITVPAALSLQQGNNIAAASQSVSDQIAIARQVAASRNQAVEVRFVTPATWIAQTGVNYAGYHAVQLWAPNEAGTATIPLGNAFNLPTGIEVSASSSLSPLLAKYSKANSVATGAMAGKYVSFFVRPNGNVVTTGTTLPPTNGNGSPIQSYFFTVVPARSDGLDTLPTNYSSLQVNPDTAHTTAYRP